jgi:hypothetical protein
MSEEREQREDEEVEAHMHRGAGLTDEEHGRRIGHSEDDDEVEAHMHRGAGAPEEPGSHA